MDGKILVAPSMLSADFARLGEEARRLEAAGADVLHIDVMDGMFVPNITFGACVIRALRSACALPLDVHMMVRQPERYIDDMVEAGARYVTVHAEATPHIHRALQQIAEYPGVVAGVAINPGTPAQALQCVLGDVGLVLVMTVNPGFGGQKLIVPALDKIAEVRAMLDRIGSPALLEVDGGVTAQNAREFTARGANLLVSGTGIFRAPDAAAAIAAMKAHG
ncbi:MAG: ribulose-phosphate 3-epimerase [Christensenellales bacterium]|nr:ribulose-phosphate 3-epimerase [Christensenellales bacterium]